MTAETPGFWSALTSVSQYAWMTLLALCGSIARGKQWVDANGRFLVSKFISEIATAICLAVGAVWAGSYLHVEMAAVAALSVLGGWLGPAAVADFVISKFGVKQT